MANTQDIRADKIDPQHRADHQSDANGGCLQDAQSAAACAGGRPYAALMNKVLVSLQNGQTRDFIHFSLSARSKKNWS
ncbi:MAG: hypothetical protein Udaeo2_15530 [Candidatus Udaeobacter sp.]|nr:MAG: hypothetical protein Udaeo2_15530 [Candidatus Udaeobacter sp.]